MLVFVSQILPPTEGFGKYAAFSESEFSIMVSTAGDGDILSSLPWGVGEMLLRDRDLTDELGY